MGTPATNVSKEMEKITLPVFVKTFKNVPAEYSKCTKCGKKVTDEKGDVVWNVRWYVTGFECVTCSHPLPHTREVE